MRLVRYWSYIREMAFNFEGRFGVEYFVYSCFVFSLDERGNGYGVERATSD